MRSGQFIPLVGINMRLVEDAAQFAYRNFAFLGNDCGVYGFVHLADELDMAALLARFDKPRCFQAAL